MKIIPKPLTHRNFPVVHKTRVVAMGNFVTNQLYVKTHTFMYSELQGWKADHGNEVRVYFGMDFLNN